MLLFNIISLCFLNCYIKFNTVFSSALVNTNIIMSHKISNSNSYITQLQSNSIQTWSYKSQNIKRVHVNLKSNGRPMYASIELWNGPIYTPSKINIYSQNGNKYDFNTVIETPSFVSNSHTVSVKNIGEVEFPIIADVQTHNINLLINKYNNKFISIQGNSFRNYIFNSRTKYIHVLLYTNGNPINARIELLQGPNNIKQSIQINNDDGYVKPFYCTLKTSNINSILKIINKSSIEFPVLASVIYNTLNNYYHYN